MPDLFRLLRPRSVAVIGGGAWGHSVVEQCLKIGFQGPIWPVHPTRRELAGMPCVARIEDLPEPPDAVFIGVNRHATVEAVETLSAMDAGGAVCFASGFAEAAEDDACGMDLQAQLVSAAGDMPVLGPNCYGFINYLDGALLWPDQHGGIQCDRGVAILGQSSNILINLTMQKRALPIAYVLAAGNQAQVGLADLAMAVMEDPRVTAIGLHIEGISDVKAFEAMAAKARDAGKPIVALKVGRSAEAQAAAISHTASLAGGDAAGRAFLARLGIGEVSGLPAFLETLKLLHVHGPLPGRALSSMSCSGGEAGLMADMILGTGTSFRALTPEQHERIKVTLSDLVTVANPLDYHTFIWGDPTRMADTYAAMFGCDFDLNLLVYDFPRTDRASDVAWACGIEALTAAQQRTGARVAMVSSLPENLSEDRAAELLAQGIAPMMGLRETLEAAGAAASIGEAWTRPVAAPVLLGQMSAEETELLDEHHAKRLLADHGLRVPAREMAETPEGAAQAAERLGFPVVVKGLGVAHKTEAGAVALGLAQAVAVREAAQSMRGVSGFLVEEMVKSGVADLIVGVVRDPVYGFALTIGAGGVLTELVLDSRTLMIPAGEPAIHDALADLRVARLLAGYRGKPPADLEAVVDAIMAVQDFVMAEADRLEELDINPLICTPSEAVAVDALVRWRGPGAFRSS